MTQGAARQMTKKIRKSNDCQLSLSKPARRGSSLTAAPPHSHNWYLVGADIAAWYFIQTDDRRTLNAGRIAGAWRRDVTVGGEILLSPSAIHRAGRSSPAV